MIGLIGNLITMAAILAFFVFVYCAGVANATMIERHHLPALLMAYDEAIDTLAECDLRDKDPACEAARKKAKKVRGAIKSAKKGEK